MATLDDINLFDRYLQAKNLQQDQRQEVADTIAPTPAQATYIAAMLAPGSGYIDAQGVFPSFPPSEAGMKDAFSGEPMPSMTQNLTEGNYLDLALQGLGVAGDTAYGIPLAGPMIGTGIKSLATLGAIAKGSKATKPKLDAKNLIETLASKKDGDTLNELSPQNFNYTKQNGIEVTLKDIDGEMAEEFPIIVNDTTVYPDIELDVIANAGPKGTGAASKELDKVLKEIDDRDMSVSLSVDSKTAGKGDIGELSDIELKRWYQRKGFIFEEGSSVGYRASKSKPLPQKEFIDIPPSEKQNILKDLNKRNEKGYLTNDHEYLGELLENVQPKGYHEHYNDIYYSDGVNKAVRTNAGYSWKGPEDMFFGGDQTEALLDSGYVLRKPTSEGIASLNESSKIQRAKDMGFDTDKPLFHGTHAEDLKEFDPAKFGRRDQGFYGKGVYLSSQKDEATMYGPNVGEYYAKGKILELSDYSELSRLLGPKSNDFTDPTEAYKIWAGKLDKIDALPPIQKNAYQDFLKAEKYFEENLKMIPTSKVTSGPAKGQTIYQGKIKDPDYDNDIVVDDIFDKSELKEMFLIEAESSYKFRGLKDMEKNLSRFVRDLDQKESYEGVDNVADFISKKAKKAGYTGINAGTETVVFDPKNIRLTKAKFDPSKSDSANLLAGVGGVTILANQPEKPIEGNRKDM
jgi:hypothetical protein